MSLIGNPTTPLIHIIEGNKARQGKARQGKTRQDKPSQAKPSQGKAIIKIRKRKARQQCKAR